MALGFDRRKYKRKQMSKFIAGECLAKKIKYKDIAEKLHITPQAFSKKMRLGQFSYDDLLIIFEVIEPSKEEITELMTV